MELLFIVSPVFTQPTAEVFIRLATGWVLCSARRTITGIVPFADPDGWRSHDRYHRFFHGAWSLAAFWRFLAVLLVERFYPVGVVPLDLDDTVYRRQGRSVNGASWWHDALRSTATKPVTCWGLNLVVLTLRVASPWSGACLALPVNLRLHRKDQTKLPRLAAEMVEELAGWLPRRELLLCADGFYASLLRHRRHLPRTHLISRLRSDAAIFELPPPASGKRGRPRKKGARLPALKDLAASITDWQSLDTQEQGRPRTRLAQARRVVWHTVDPVPLLLVISRDPQDHHEDSFFFSTDLSARPAEVISAYAGHWSIEECFRNAKQHLGGQQPQAWKDSGPERAAAVSFWLYAAVWAWYLRDGRQAQSLPKAPWYPAKDHPSFQDALNSLRRCIWRSRIFPTNEPLPVPAEKVAALIDALASAA
jgi:hypothetical protein